MEGHIYSGVNIEIETLLAILFLGGWGGIVSFLTIKRDRRIIDKLFSCAKQIIISCFTALLVSLFGIEKHVSNVLIFVYSGVGGVLGTQILLLLRKKFMKMIAEESGK